MAPPCRIYGSGKDRLFALVSPEDYQWALQWRWSAKWSRGGKKAYLRRVGHLKTGPDELCEETGRRIRNRIQSTIWLHIEVMKRTGVVPPDLFHTIVDHENGNGLDCQRGNLRWATPRMNVLNRNSNNVSHHF